MPELLNGAAPPITRYRPRRDVDAGVVEAGVEAWRRRKADARACWEDWLLIGKALLDLRAQAMVLAGKNKPIGKGYNLSFSRLLRDHHFDDIDGADRSKLMRLVEDPEVQRWRDGLPEAERLRLNHPHSVQHAWRCKNRGGKWRRNQQAIAASNNDGANTTAQVEHERDDDADLIVRAGPLVVKAHKATGLADDCRKFAGEVDAAILRAVKEAAEAWSDIADLFEARFGEGT